MSTCHNADELPGDLSLFGVLWDRVFGKVGFCVAGALRSFVASIPGVTSDEAVLRPDEPAALCRILTPADPAMADVVILNPEARSEGTAVLADPPGVGLELETFRNQDAV